MKFAIIGSGNVGSSIARAVTRTGHDAVVADPSTESLQALPADLPVATTTSNLEAVAGADVVVLAVPFGAVQEIATALRDELAGKIVIDVTNPVAADLSGLSIDGISGAELVAKAAPEARVVKAFNTVFAEHMDKGRVGDQQLTIFAASDDEAARKTVLGLAKQIGFDAVDSGALINARSLETMGFFNIQLGYTLGLGTKMGLRLFHDEPRG